MSARDFHPCSYSLSASSSSWFFGPLSGYLAQFSSVQFISHLLCIDEVPGLCPGPGRAMPGMVCVRVCVDGGYLILDV